jgi:signal recognition particle receptor subunit beta
MDFGRITMADDLILYLFGTPGQTRFWFMWDELIRGAVGAAVLVDTRRIADAFAPLDYFENRHLPYIVALNCFDNAPRYEPDEVREALAIPPHVPLVLCDARHRDSVKAVLVQVVEHAMATLVAEQSGGYPAVVG